MHAVWSDWLQVAQATPVRQHDLATVADCDGIMHEALRLEVDTIVGCKRIFLELWLLFLYKQVNQLKETFYIQNDLQIPRLKA